MNPVGFHRHDDLGVRGVLGCSEDGSGGSKPGKKIGVARDKLWPGDGER